MHSLWPWLRLRMPPRMRQAPLPPLMLRPPTRRPTSAFSNLSSCPFACASNCVPMSLRGCVLLCSFHRGGRFEVAARRIGRERRVICIVIHAAADMLAGSMSEAALCAVAARPPHPDSRVPARTETMRASTPTTTTTSTRATRRTTSTTRRLKGARATLSDCLCVRR